MNPEIYSYIIPKLLDNGALDVYLTNIIMKKNRPAIKLSVLVSENKKRNIINEIFKETTTFGIRMYKVDREILDRKFKKVVTKYGQVNMKIGMRNGDIIQKSPEYEDVKKIAKENNVSIKEIYNEVMKQKESLD